MTRAITRMFIARHRMGLTQAQVAAEIGVTQPRISAWENRVMDLPPKRRAQLAKLLDADSETLTDDA